MILEEFFPDEDYRFHFRFERSDPKDFFKPTSRSEELLAERRSWLKSEPQCYSALLPAGLALLEETIELAQSWEVSTPSLFPRPWDTTQAVDCCRRLGCALEPDFLLLKSDPERPPTLVGGAVCFPSSWSLEEKIGKPMTLIHQVVPGLNDTLGAQIDGFLNKLKPGVAWLRSNWGLSRSAELNQHPARRLRRLDDSVRADEVWLRVEHQALVALPRTSGVLFGIRIVNFGLEEIRAKQSLAARLARGLRTMPEPIAVYKGLATARERLIGLLQ